MQLGILLVLGRAPAAANARQFAFSLAKEVGAALTGLAIVDPDIIAPPEATPLGGDAYKVHKDKAALNSARADAIAFERAFEQECKSAGIGCESSFVEGRTLQAVVDACALHDLVVIGSDGASSTAHGANPVVLDFLRDNPRPVVVCSPFAQSGSSTLVAYDGSAAAMRSLQLFVLLRLGKKSPAAVVTVHEHQTHAEATSRIGADYLRRHGYEVSSHPIESSEPPHEILIEEARRLGAGLIVAGAFGHRSWREWMLGTTTQRLIELSPVPVFVHH